MTQNNEDARPGAGSGTGAKTAGEHVPNSVPRAWHEQAEWEGQWQYAAGWADGYAAGWQAVADEVARATGVKPYSAKAVIQWLCRSIDLDYRERRAQPYTSPANGTDLGVAERQMFGELGRAA